jgi:hypothetical protein
MILENCRPVGLKETYLCPSGSSEPNSEYRKKPCVGLTEVGQNDEDDGPDEDEEDNDKDKGLPMGNGNLPEEPPVTTIRLNDSQSDGVRHLN